MNFKLYDVVVLMEDLPHENLHKGAIGAIVEILDEGVLLVEFADADGQTVEMLDLRASQLMKVFYEPMREAAA